MTEIDQILRAIESVRVSAQPEEYEIHEQLARALDAGGIEYIHECRLLPGRRIDFARGRIGIEVKKGSPAARPLVRQLEKYLSRTELDAIIVVAQRACPLPETICGKTVRLVTLNRLWGVALP